MRNTVIALLICLLLAACERDDLCTPDQATTPRMTIVFKDVTNPTQIKEVTSLRVKEIGSGEFAPLDFNGSMLLEDADTIYLPLRNNFDLTSYDFFKEEDGVNLISNVDFRYSRNEEFVSRACGFRTLYNGLGSGVSANTGWINRTQVVDTTITNNLIVHVEIFH